MNASVFIAWRGGTPECGQWSPVARMDRVDGEFRFAYTQGALTLAGFRPFPGMENLHREYRSRTLFPMLTNRLLSKSRPEYAAWLAWGGFDPRTTPDPLAILGVTEGIRQTDALEVFPCPLPDAKGRYQTRFFVHGLRHASAIAHDLLQSLRVGDALALQLENDNLHDPQAVAIVARGEEIIRLGYVPRYLAREVRDLLRAHGSLEAINVRVARINHDAPLQMRLLCQLTAPWPENFEPCSDKVFLPLIPAEEQQRAHGA